MECCGLQERELNGEKCQNAMDHGRVSMQDSENGRKMVYGKKLSSDADMENLSIDSTMAKAHHSTNGGFKKGRKNPLEEPVED